MSERGDAEMRLTPLLLDTHAWVWWLAESAELPARTRDRVERARSLDQLWVSAVSAWEVALLAERGRLQLREPVRAWVTRAQAILGLRFLPLDPDIAIRSVELQGIHTDAADRFIVASAERLGATLVTRDERIAASVLVPTLWG